MARNRPADRRNGRQSRAAPLNARSASSASAGRRKQLREARKPCILWLTGLPAAGKTTLAREITQRLETLGVRAFVLDGDDLRLGLNSDLGFSHADRNESVRRAGHAAKLLLDTGTIAVAALISPFRDHRQRIRALAGPDRFVEIFVDAPLHVCERRDPKGLYASARAGDIHDFTGIDSPYEPPETPDIRLLSAESPPGDLAAQVIRYLEKGEYI
ncbi:MAG: adenylyl-sulfate kinase [Gammaproteobacteria bacterium]|nr:adenylyl-sulfate kinase [Gammaproteobacteria bacterium]